VQGRQVLQGAAGGEEVMWIPVVYSYILESQVLQQAACCQGGVGSLVRWSHSAMAKVKVHMSQPLQVGQGMQQL
jgi:hypothetical protein